MRKRKRGGEDASEGAPEWMLTYSDMVTLLLTFFIMLFSMATIDSKKFMEVSHSLRSAFLYNSTGDKFDLNSGKDFISISEANSSLSQDRLEDNGKGGLIGKNAGGYVNITAEERQRKLEDVIGRIEAAIERLGLGEYITINDQKQFLVLRFDSVILFELGKADILPSGREILIKLGQILKELDNEINIEGHTDNLPINTLLFPTNWELSTKRATNVVLFLVDKCDFNPSKLVASGRGEFKPIKPNDSDENRRKNRRIDIIIEK